MMYRRSLLLGSLAVPSLAVGLAGCASPSVADYAAEKPALDLRAYFNGMVDAWGMFTDRNGKVVKRFTVAMACHWQDRQGILDEDFVYADGRQEKRVWTLQDLGHGQYTGTAADVVGRAEGQVQGNAFRWRYTLALPVSDRIIHVEMDDWMFLISDRVMLNKARMSKFGIHLGDVTLSFSRRT